MKADRWTGDVLDVLHGTRQTIGSGCSRAWRLCSFALITDKKMELSLQAEPGRFSLLQMGHGFHPFAKFLGCKSSGMLRNKPT